MKSKLIACCVLVAAALTLGASTWEGSAVVASASDFPSEGLFGACNSFPLNSTVDVQNLENGRKVSVLITGNVSNPAIFLALSPKAAGELGMKAGASARVRVVAQAAASSTPAPPSTAKTGESTDPDYNPRLLADIAAKPYTPGAEGAATDFMSLLGAGYVPPQAPAAATAPATPPEAAKAGTVPPAATTVAPASVAQPGQAASLLETSAAAAEAPAGAALPASVPNPAAPPLPESSGVAAKAPASAATASLDNPKPLEPESVSGADTPVPPAATPTETALAVPEGTKSPGEAAQAVTKPAEASPAEDAALAQPSPDEKPSTVEALASPATSGTEAELSLPEAASPESFALEVPERLESAAPELALAEPSPDGGKAATAAAAPEVGPAEGEGPPRLSDPGMSSPSAVASTAAIPDPELGPDLLPEALLERLTNPVTTPPTVALADCEVELKGMESPEALALDGKAPPPGSTTALALADASAPPAPAKDSGEIVLSLQPTAPRPPQKTATALATPSAPSPATAATAQAAPAGQPAAKVEPAATAPKAAVAPATTPPSATTTAVATPPKAGVAAKPSGTPAREPTDLRRLEAMAKGSYYVQIGLFGSEEAMRQAINALSKQFPILYEKVEGSKSTVLYRLFVGPIKRDESGLILTKVKALGYRDAVIKQG
jgi:hypothetical protein